MTFQCTWLDLVQHLGVVLLKARLNVAQSINNSRLFPSFELHSYPGLDEARRNLLTLGQNLFISRRQIRLIRARSLHCLATKMAMALKIEHLWEWKEIACSDNASGEHRPKVEFLEIFRYPHLQRPVMNKGTLDDLSMSDWLAKAFLKRCI